MIRPKDLSSAPSSDVTASNAIRAALRDAVEQSGLTYEEVGMRMGFSKSSARAAMSRLLNPKINLDPRLSTLLALAKAIGRPIRDFIDVTIQPTASLNSPSPIEEIDLLVASLTEKQKSMVRKCQIILKQLTGTRGYGSYDDNVVLCLKVNEMARKFGIRLLYDDQTVTIRFVKAPHSKTGTFEVRSATKDRKKLIKSALWPLLTAATHGSLSDS